MLFETGHEGEHGSRLGEEYLINDAGYVSAVHGPTVHSTIKHHASLFAPAATLVSSTGSELEINLIWDSSVANAPTGFTQAVLDAARLYVADFAHPTAAGGIEKINIRVGYGEIAGTGLASNALGESESYGYLTNYATVINALHQEGYVFKASNEPIASQFFVTSAEVKAFGLISPTSSATDGFVGFSTLGGTGYSWNFNASAGGANIGTGPSQFDLEAVAWHEISEVMGRIGMEGQVINGAHTYTPLDLFNFKSYNVLALSPSSGYFSIDNGATSLGTYNNSARYGGDIADWASNASPLQSATRGLPLGHYDAYDAFTFGGLNGAVSSSDIAELASLGYA
jgi:hypothetical protein